MEVIDGKGRTDYMKHKAGKDLRNFSLIFYAIKGEKGNLEKNVLGSCYHQMTDQVSMRPRSPAHSLGHLPRRHGLSANSPPCFLFCSSQGLLNLYSLVHRVLSSLVHAKTVFVLLLHILSFTVLISSPFSPLDTHSAVFSVFLTMRILFYV